MHRKTAFVVGSSALMMAASSARGQTRWLQGPEPTASTVFAEAPGADPVADRVKPEPPKPRPPRQPEIVYLDVEAGYQNVSLSSLVARDLRPQSVGTTASGAVYGIGGGFRLAFLTLGGRARTARVSVGDLSSIDGELGARINMNRLEPRFTFAAGYARLSATGSELAGIPDLDIHGWNARAGVGCDYYADKNFSIGLNFTGDVLVMARPGVDLSTSPQAQAEERVKTCQAIGDPMQKQQCVLNTLHDAEGASAGFASTLSVVMGLHF
jgi:hypothetical protein